MTYNRINPIAKSIGIASLAYALSACGGPVEREWKPDSSVPVSYPWRVNMCEDLRQGLQRTSLPPEERQEEVQRCDNECRPPGNEASLRYCADLYCCANSGYISIILCGEYRDLGKERYSDSWKDDWKGGKEFRYSIYSKCMERFGVKPY